MNYNQQPSVQLTANGSYGLLYSGKVTVDEADGAFEIKNLLPGTVFINAGPRTVEIAVNEPRTGVTIDLDEPGATPVVRAHRLAFRRARRRAGPDGAGGGLYRRSVESGRDAH